MTPCMSGGYQFIRTSLNGKKTTCLVHRMVLITFNPIEDYEKYSVNHINGIRTDNRLENLEWKTITDNVFEMMKNRKELNLELTRIIQIYGYEKTLKILQKIN